MMQLATCVDGQPWCCTLYFAHDNQHNLYFVSLDTTRHVVELKKNPKVAGAVALPHTYGEMVHGVQFEGVAREIADPEELRTCAEAYAERFNRYTLANDILNGIIPSKLYQIKPTSFVLFDQAHYPDNPRQTWELNPATTA